MDHLLPILIIGLVALVRWLLADGGLRKLLEGLNNDLNDKTSPPVRTTPPLTTRQTPVPGQTFPHQETEDEKRLRKFREALGMPVKAPSSSPPPVLQRRELPRNLPRGIPPVPPIVAQPSPSPFQPPLPRKLSPDGGQARQERERIERKLAERQRQLSAPPVPRSPVSKNPARRVSVLETENQAGVGRYFDLENFDQPGIEPGQVVLDSSIPPALSADRPPVPAGGARLSDVLGGGSDLRRLILAQEILGRPKCLQST